jgi:catecholate siderophore receptor
MGMDADTPTRDNVWTRRNGVAPSVSLQLDDETKATLSYIYQGEEGSQDYGIPYLPQPAYSATTGRLTNPGYNGNGSAVGPVPIRRQNWFGISGGPKPDLVSTQTHILTGMIEHELGSGFKISNGTRYIANDRFSRVTAPRALGNAAGTEFANGSNAGLASAGYPVNLMTIGRERRERETDATYAVNQTDLTGKFDTGFINHTIATGLELSQETRNQNGNTICVQTAAFCRTSLSSPTQNNSGANQSTPLAPNETTSNNVGVYVSDQMKITRYFELLSSLRFDNFSTKYTDFSLPIATRDLSRTDGMLSYRFGGVVHPTENSSIYIAYGNSYNPSAELGTLSSSPTNAASVSLAPERSESIEAGVKVDVLANRLSLTGAVFRIEKTNLRITNDPSLPTAQQFLILDGLARVDGVEVGMVGKLTDKWQVIAGYSYLDSEIAKTTDLSQLGRQLPNTPPNNVSVWSTYDITEKLTIGGGLTYQDMAFANVTNTAYVPSFVKLDAMIQYKFTPRSVLQLNIYNITDELYYAQYYPGHVVPASGRWAALSWRVRW